MMALSKAGSPHSPTLDAQESYEVLATTNQALIWNFIGADGSMYSKQDSSQKRTEVHQFLDPETAAVETEGKLHDEGESYLLLLFMEEKHLDDQLEAHHAREEQVQNPQLGSWRTKDDLKLEYWSERPIPTVTNTKEVHCRKRVKLQMSRQWVEPQRGRSDRDLLRFPPRSSTNLSEIGARPAAGAADDPPVDNSADAHTRWETGRLALETSKEIDLDQHRMQVCAEHRADHPDVPFRTPQEWIKPPGEGGYSYRKRKSKQNVGAQRQLPRPPVPQAIDSTSSTDHSSSMTEVGSLEAKSIEVNRFLKESTPKRKKRLGSGDQVPTPDTSGDSAASATPEPAKKRKRASSDDSAELTGPSKRPSTNDTKATSNRSEPSLGDARPIQYRPHIVSNETPIQPSTRAGGSFRTQDALITVPMTIDDEGRSPYTYAVLIALAILHSPHHRLQLANIYRWIRDKFPFYKNKAGFENHIRHNLSSRESPFYQQERPKNNPLHPGNGEYWALECEGALFINMKDLAKSRVSRDQLKGSHVIVRSDIPESDRLSRAPKKPKKSG